MQKLLKENDELAQDNRAFFKEKGILCVNVMGAPGSGKTTLIMALTDELKKRGLESMVLEGDLYSSLDAEAFEQKKVPAVQINTCGECHLDAAVIREGAEKLALRSGVLFIENVGNLICPAEFDLGEHVKLLASSVPEGDDKPFKYVPMFSYIDLVALTKYDLKEAVGFDRENFEKGLKALSEASLFETAIRNGKDRGRGVELIADFLVKSF